MKKSFFRFLPVLLLAAVLLPFAARAEGEQPADAAQPVYEPGAVVTFGAYEQDADTENGPEPIEWVVLDAQKNKVLLISRYVLDGRKYGNRNGSSAWSSAPLRKWLNETFLKKAFTKEEQKKILTSYVKADKNPDYKAKPGSSVKDKIFLLSIVEAKKYMPSSADRRCEGTAYAFSRLEYTGVMGRCDWWLRSPGINKWHAAYVLEHGGIFSSGVVVECPIGIRPAMWISIG